MHHVPGWRHTAGGKVSAGRLSDSQLPGLRGGITRGLGRLYGELRGWFEMIYAARDPQCAFIVSWKRHGITEVKTAWKKARERAGIPALLIHDWRRTAVRNMIRAGISEKRALEISGHKTNSILKRFDISDERTSRRTATTWRVISKRSQD